MSNLETHDRNRRREVTFGALVVAVPVLVFAAIGAPRSCARQTNSGSPPVASTAANKNQTAPKLRSQESLWRPA